MRRSASWSIWAFLGLIALELAGALVLAISRGSGPGSVATATATVLFALTTAIVGSFIGLRRPGHRIGLLLRIAAFAFATGALIVTYVEMALLVRPGSLPIGPVVVILGDIVFGLGFGISATYLLLLFPTGRLPSPGWRPVAWLAGIGLGILMLGVTLGSGPFDGLPIDNPIALEESSLLLLIAEGGGFYLLLGAILASVASLVVRYRRAIGEERQQLKWAALGVVMLAIGIAGTALWEILNGSAEFSDDTENFLTTISITMVPISIGVAILRYRLYDIDRIISRTVSYGVVTALLLGAYGALVFGLRDLLPVQGSVAVAVSTLAVAAMFNPLRSRIQNLVDMRFNRSRYDIARTIEAFSERLRTEVDMDELARDLKAVAVDSMQPVYLSLWLRD
jgi:hypothetical protein